MILYDIFARLESRPRNSSVHSHTETPSSGTSQSEIEEIMNNVDLMDRLNVSSVFAHPEVWDQTHDSCFSRQVAFTLFNGDLI